MRSHAQNLSGGKKKYFTFLNDIVVQPRGSLVFNEASAQLGDQVQILAEKKTLGDFFPST